MGQTDEIINYNLGLNYTKYIYNIFSNMTNATDKLSCVNQFAVANYNYFPREEIYSIDDMFDKGADCKSYSLYYATLAKMMGYDYLFVQLPDHIFTLVYFGGGYCILDEKYFHCFLYEEKIK